MYRITIALSILTVFVGGCSSVPKPVIPDGSNRTPVNTQVKIDDYSARTAEENANYRERTALARQVEALNRQMAEMKLSMMAATANNADGQTSTPKARPVSQQGKAPAIAIGNTETMEVRDQAIVFRVVHPFAQTAFHPSDTFQKSLIKAAHDSRQIEIRGRTDSNVDDDANRQIALERALKARLFLVKHGVHPRKIRISYLASGGFLVDNATEEGRSRNRRVEVEAMDIDTTAFKADESMTIGSTK